ncbi:helix-turn-helix transcriptional regulator [Olsenella sp. An270]|uniref:heat shock protein transcriptional repressor HspR n=1 Tax=Olsenella sp. An270 TaxID=1965615 RepID=UPI000B36694F|nr:helix-turn-helix transcriptional regulator [Olsenella sp. An270]OUO58635.1 MerR family transcriptional regulator [Olsenella sp. An270]
MPRSDGDARDRGRDRDKPLYMISVAAELTGMHPQTLRVYEQKGLVTPGRSRGNTRLYSQADIERLNLISKLTDEGINLAGVVRILDMRERMLEREAELDELRARVRDLEDEVHEYKMQEKITALARYDASSSPEQVMRRLLLNGASDEKDGE